MSKQRGAAMSSRLTPPKLGAMARTVWMITSLSWEAMQMG